MESFVYTLLAAIFKTIFPFLVLIGIFDISSRACNLTYRSSGVVFCLACITLLAIISRSILLHISFLNVSDLLTGISITFGSVGSYLICRWVWEHKPINFVLLSIFLVLGLPVLTIILYQNQYNWDDYSHWLPLARHLYNAGDFVSANNYPLNVAMPSYPPALAIMASIFHAPFSSFNEKIPIFVTNFSIALMCFTIFEKLERADGECNVLDRVGAICAGILAMSFLFTWHQYSSYADVPLSILICILMLRLSELKINEKITDQPSQIYGITGCLILIPLVKNYGVYLSLSLLAAWLFVSLGWANVRTKNNILTHIKFAIVFGALAILSHSLWIITYETGGLAINSRIQPLTNWKWEHLLNISDLMLSNIWASRYVFYLTFLIIPLLYPIKLFFRNSPDARAIKITLLFILSNFFLTFLFYLAVLSDDEVDRMLSLERYLMPSFLMSLIATGIWLYNNLSATIFHFLQKFNLLVIILVASFIQLNSISKILSPSYRGDDTEYTELLKTAIDLTETQSVGFFYNVDSRLNLPHLIYKLPSGYIGSWILKHDLQKLHDTVYDYETYKAWLGDRNPDVICFTGQLSVTGTKYIELEDLSIQHPLKCLKSRHLAEVLGLV